MPTKSYKEKKAVPLLDMVKDALISALVKNVQLNGMVEKLKQQYKHSRKQEERLEQKLDLVEMESNDFRGEILDFNHVKAVIGESEVKSIIEQTTVVEPVNLTINSPRSKDVDR